MSGPAGQEFSGKSVEEATSDGLRAMGLRAEDATVEIISRGSRGLFGLGSEPAVVRIAPLGAVASPNPTIAQESAAVEAVPSDDSRDESILEASIVEEVVASAPLPVEEVAAATGSNLPTAKSEPSEVDDEVSAMGVEMLGELVRLMGFDCTVTAAWRDADDITEERHLLLNVRGPEASGLIGRRGETLENIQYLLRLMVNQRMHRWLNIIVDIEEFRARRMEHLTHVAQRMAQQAVESGRSQALEPMTPNERRIVHLVLRDDVRVFTESTGEGERRKVVIFPKR